MRKSLVSDMPEAEQRAYGRGSGGGGGRGEGARGEACVHLLPVRHTFVSPVTIPSTLAQHANHSRFAMHITAQHDRAYAVLVRLFNAHQPTAHTSGPPPVFGEAVTIDPASHES